MFQKFIIRDKVISWKIMYFPQRFIFLKHYINFALLSAGYLIIYNILVVKLHNINRVILPILQAFKF